MDGNVAHLMDCHLANLQMPQKGAKSVIQPTEARFCNIWGRCGRLSMGGDSTCAFLGFKLRSYP